MDPRIVFALERTGATSATSLVAAGVSRREIERAVSAGVLLRLRRNALVDGERWRTSPPWERHGMRAVAVAAGLTTDAGCPVVLTHHSALAVHGISLHGVDDRVHLSWADGRRGRTSALVRVHRLVPERFLDAAAGLPVVSVAAACVQVAAACGPEAALVSVDDALHRERMTMRDLEEAVAAVGAGRTSSAPRQVLALADSKAESAAESRARWCFHLAGLPPATPQVELRDEYGELWARLDFLIEEAGVVIEVDGMRKYRDIDDLRAEKLREDRLRELGYEVVRLTWADLSDPRVVRRKVGAALDRARRRRTA
ncbi:endonuclease domain-containing protein [Janibacter sp. CX7]|uniref:endonuclease domain-containing protein n=1 Tax=Janibacter sp. CX7 TaxID=2963431 RepID=UPI0020CF0528|nr:endonuclease domain-containing protein [Janibacter sp. CX7]UTT67156.1 endonuclease domain-containing protein [Janibacter sp. CX7]